MKITDGKRTVEIRMMTWTGNGYTPDWSTDFFNGKDHVPDVGYCIEQANDWKNRVGDFCGDEETEEEREVFVEEVEEVEEIKLLGEREHHDYQFNVNRQRP